MERKTIIIGNGLGMALDANHFSLDTALYDIWNDEECLSGSQKALIKQCLEKQGAGDRPTSEDDLDVLHRVVIACDFLCSVGAGDVHWLTEYGQEFPEAIRKYITSVAWHFHYHSDMLPSEFLDSLVAFVEKSRSHVATLNYDNLLYQQLIERGILRGYDGCLVDGFHTSSGFNEENLERRYDNDFGYYLHLHGSPLYVSNGEMIIKQLQGEAKEIPSPHLVLTHVEHKPSVIDGSSLLSAYWRYLGKAILECNHIIVFGYSGLDMHLNRFIKARAESRLFTVVEWEGDHEFDERQEFWESELGGMVELQLLPNILEFRDWGSSFNNSSITNKDRS